MGIINNGLAARQPAGNKIIAIGSRLELFVDDALIEKMDGVHLQLQTPQMQPLSDRPFPTGIHSPTERAPYATVIKDGEVYRAYYHDIIPNYQGPWPVKNPAQIVCYAESADGVNWVKPNLGLYEIERRVEWKQKPDLGALQGKPVRLRFVMTECDLYSFRFQ